MISRITFSASCLAVIASAVKVEGEEREEIQHTADFDDILAQLDEEEQERIRLMPDFVSENFNQLEDENGEIEHITSPDDYTLSELKAAEGVEVENYRTCGHAHTRLKAGPANLWKAQLASHKFVDPEFPLNEAIHWSDLPHADDMKKFQDTASWHRVIDLYPPSHHYSLWGSNGVHPDDIRQGQIGNCWAIAAASAVAETPADIKNIFVNKSESAHGIYGLNMYPLGVKATLTIDDYMPVRSNGYYYDGIFARPGNSKSLWGPIVEKGLAKLYGSYAATNGGWGGSGVKYLTGNPMFIYYHNKYSRQQVWEAMDEAAKYGDIITSHSNTGTGNHDNLSYNGIAHNHAYTVIEVITTSHGLRLLKMRNPWGGNTEYKGPYSKYDYRWTSSLKHEVGFESKADGSFYIDLDTYLREFASTNVNIRKNSMSESTFIMANDPGYYHGESHYCGHRCSRHMFKIESTQRQTVIISLNTWPMRSYPAACAVRGLRHVRRLLVNNKWSQYKSFAYGASEMHALVEPGKPVYLDVEFDWTNPYVTKDFSVVAHGMNGHHVGITHTAGLHSNFHFTVL